MIRPKRLIYLLIQIIFEYRIIYYLFSKGTIQRKLSESYLVVRKNVKNNLKILLVILSCRLNDTINKSISINTHLKKIIK